ncbi:TPA: hypothetical protein U1617_000077 [Streptococcus suis]|nr:hypothetical protein [Streptococcus suis]HEM5489563.1 hypothetical protein [Streptococcus suis]
MTLSTSVTNQTSTRTPRTFITYLATTAFLFIFSRIYESLSYGEVSFFMHYMFCVTLIGGALLLGMLTLKPNLSRMTFNLWNSGVATITAGFLLRGIINLSGRSTTLDQPYWFIGAGFLVLALISLFFTGNKNAQLRATAQ